MSISFVFIVLVSYFSSSSDTMLFLLAYISSIRFPLSSSLAIPSKLSPYVPNSSVGFVSVNKGVSAGLFNASGLGVSPASLPCPA